MAVARMRELADAYDAPREADRSAIFEELESLGAGEAALELASSKDAGERALAARIMYLLREPSHPAVLERLLADEDPEVARRARRAFGAQKRTEEWESIAARLARTDEPELRAAAERWLAGEP